MSEVIGFGCRLNIAESAVLARLSDDPDLVIVNSCAVTSEAVRQARQAIRRTARARPGARIVVTGCAAEVEAGAFAMPEVAAVVGRKGKFDRAAYVIPAKAGTHPPLLKRAPPVRRGDGVPRAPEAFHTRAFVPVQTGCDHACTFCIIARARGPSVSTPPADVVTRIAALVDGGCNEVVLSGVDLTSYAHDGATLGLLVQRILRETSLSRLRLSSIDSIEADADLIEAIATEPRLMPQLHLSLQSGDDLILKRMKRRHSRADSVDFCAKLRAARPGIAFAADFITGFPTESEAMFANTLALVDACGIERLHVFPYSPRPGTPAARMPQVPAEVARERAARLRAVGAARTAAALIGQVGRPQRVLVERDGVSGHSETFLPARLRDAAPRGTIARVTARGVIDGVLDCQ